MVSFEIALRKFEVAADDLLTMQIVTRDPHVSAQDLEDAVGHRKIVVVDIERVDCQRMISRSQIASLSSFTRERW